MRVRRRSVEQVLCALLVAVCFDGLPADAASFLISEPSDDRWHYPFSFTPGTRGRASTFGTPGDPDFNDRDAIILVAWRTAGHVDSQQPPEDYRVQGLSVTLTNQSGADWPVDLTVDEWSTYPSETGLDEDPGRPIELFGAGFGPEFSRETWVETSFFVGGTGDGAAPRDPFPFVFQEETLELLHVEDNVKGLHNDKLDESVTSFTPIPWAIGRPVGYEPGNQSVPFDVVFEIDLERSQCAVRAYYQQGLADGRIFAVVSSNQETVFMGAPTGFPSFFTKEGTGTEEGAQAPGVRILLSRRFGDFDADDLVRLGDGAAMVGCLTGPRPPETSPLCRCDVFDDESDDDVDLRDFARFQSEYMVRW